MRQKLADLDNVICQLRPFLQDYLQEHDIDTSSNFSCLNPKHEDNNPSMSCGQNPENAFCFSCFSTMDIFQAAHWLENKPINGPGFIEENVKYLADKYGITLELEEMTEDELYRYRTYRAYADAAKLIVSRSLGNSNKLNTEIQKRGWNEETAAKVGTVNFKEFRAALKNMGYEPGFQDEIDLGRQDIFADHNMIFTICDEWGHPVGFAARNLDYSDDNPTTSKYTNQRTTGLRCNIYQKSKRLYEIHTATKIASSLYLFEGYTDVLTAQNAGLYNCAGIGGVAFTSQHIDLIKRLGISNIIICLDGDTVGRSKALDLLDNYFAGQQDLRVELINLPDESDPDDFIREQGLEAFLALKKWSAFQWCMNRYNDDDDPGQICATMIPLIINEPSRIQQDKMCGQLAEFTGIEKRVIVSELERLQNETEHKRSREKLIVLEETVSEANRAPEDTLPLLYAAIGRIEQIDTKYDCNILSVDSTVQFIERQKLYEESLKGDFAGFHLSVSGLKGFGDQLNGNWREGVFIAIGGRENVGKSSWCCQLAYEIASIAENDACVIYHTIDDSKEQILPRFICQAYGNCDMTLNQVRNPNYSKRYEEDGMSTIQRRQLGYQEILKLVRNGRLILKDISDGTSLAFGETLIKYYRQQFPKRNIVYFIDNLHKAPDFDNYKETRTKFRNLSNKTKNMATKYGCCIVATVEYVKIPPGIIPNNSNIAETRALLYDTSLIGHMYNELHEKGLDAKCIHEYDGQILPRIRLGIGKNKITEFKDRLFFDFYPASGRFQFVDTKIVEQEYRDQSRIMKEMQEETPQLRGYFGGNDNDQQEF